MPSEEKPMWSRLASWMRGEGPSGTADLAEHRENEAVGETWAFRLGLALLLLGIACRLHVYLSAFPIWRDEAALALNFALRDFGGLLHQLDNYQVAPLFFLWIEKAVYAYLGGSEALLRLLPLAAGVLGLVLLWRLARLSLTPLPAALAVGFLAVAQAPIHLASMIKPYSLDLFLAALLLSLAAGFLRAPARSGRLAALAVVIPLAVPASYPVVFIAGGISLVLLPVVWRQGRLAGRCWFAVFNVLFVAVFAVHLRFVGREAPDAETPAVLPYMSWFWQGGFLPRQPLAALHWIFRCHVSHLFSYPVKFNGGGLLGLVLVSAGTYALYRRRRYGLLGLCLTPLALNFVAAALRRYPYAGDQRLEQHLVPGLCLLLGAGAAELIQRLASSAAWQKRWAAAAAGLLILVGLAGSLADAWQPYHDIESCWARDVARHLSRQVGPQDRIVLMQPGRDTLDCLRWHLVPWARQTCSPAEIDWSRRQPAEGRLWLVDQGVEPIGSLPDPPIRDLRQALPVLEQTGWHAVGYVRFLARGSGPFVQQVYRYHCDLHVLEAINGARVQDAAATQSRN
jgi:hypothetical protein